MKGDTMVIKFIIIIAIIIFYSVYLVQSTIMESWDFWQREYDSKVNKSSDFYREFNISKKWFIKRTTMVSAFALLFIVITLSVLLFL